METAAFKDKFFRIALSHYGLHTCMSHEADLEADARKSYILLSLNSKLRSRVFTSLLIHSEETRDYFNKTSIN